MSSGIYSNLYLFKFIFLEISPGISSEFFSGILSLFQGILNKFYQGYVLTCLQVFFNNSPTEIPTGILLEIVQQLFRVVFGDSSRNSYIVLGFFGSSSNAISL